MAAAHPGRALPASAEALLSAARSIVTELDLDAVLERLLDAAIDTTGARYAAIGVLDESRSSLERFVTRGIPEAQAAHIGDLPRGRGILGLLIKDDPRPLRLSSVSRHSHSYGFPPGHPPMERFLGVPILIRGEPWGNLYLTDKVDAEFDDEDERAAMLLAEWAAVAVDNARQFQRSERRRVELERATQTLEVTTEIARAVGGETDLDKVLELLVKRARALVDARAVAIALVDDADLVFAAGAGFFDQEAVGTRAPLDRSVLARAISGLRPTRSDDVELRRPWERNAFGEEHADTLLAVPLVSKGRALGALLAVDRTDPALGGFTPDDARLLAAFGASAATAVATAQAVADDRVREAIGAGERERTRWARELHDETLQELAALAIHLTSLKRRDDVPAIKQGIDVGLEKVQAQITSLRRLITDLRPADLDELGLEAALRALADRHRDLPGRAPEIALDLPAAPSLEGRLATEIETTIYRLAQEALGNVVKHAGASRVVLRLAHTSGRVELEVADDGSGFDRERPTSGFGLVGMRERAELLGGSFELATSEEGTRVRAVLPARR